MKKTTYLLFLFACLLILSACQSQQQNEKKIVPFSFTDQDGQSFGMSDLNGTIWIADFIFTECTTVCEPMTVEMAALQQRFKEEDIQVEFVSFTVDPVVDTPNTLKSYVENFTDDLSNWHLLTGYTQEDIEIFARDQFQTIVQKPMTTEQVLHGTNFYLVNKRGVLVNEYNYINASYVEEMIEDIRRHSD